MHRITPYFVFAADDSSTLCRTPSNYDGQKQAVGAEIEKSPLREAAAIGRCDVL